jgi:hypothetical protein
MEEHSKDAFASAVDSAVFEVGETLFYTKEGWSGLVKVKALILDADDVLRITVTTTDGKEIETTREFLKSPNNPDIGWIPASVPEFKSTAKCLTDEDIRKISCPHHLSPLQQEFLSMHHKLFHLPYPVMLRMAKLGILPKRFLKLRNDLPPCVSCMFGQAHRNPWRHKTSSTNKGGTIRRDKKLKAGQMVYTDQLVSAQPGLVPQEKGSATRARIWGATVCVDGATDYTKVHLMEHATGDSTLEAKAAFERDAMSRGVDIRGYHADNGRYAEHLFRDDCKQKSQSLNFCGVGAHHQNGIAEAKMKQLTLASRTMLLHAQRHWPEYISTILWSFALMAAADRINNLHIDLNGQTPEMKFSNVGGLPTRMKHFHTFGCPAYVLDARLQDAGGAGPPKWDPRARLGIYLGHSPSHAGSVALVLNPRTGLVSPQFHVVIDDDSAQSQA